MKKITFSPCQMLIIGTLIFCSILLWISDSVFSWTESGNPVTFAYLQEGEYSLTVSCMPLEQSNSVIVYSKAAVDENGKGDVELARVQLESEQSVVVIPLNIDQGVFDVCVKTLLDTEEESAVLSANLKSNGILYHDGAFLGGLCFLLAGALIFIFLKVPKEQYLLPLAAIGFGLLAGVPIYADFMVRGHDFEFHLLRIEGIYQAVASGDFPVRINPLQLSGYGYLSSTLYPQLFLYPVAFLRFLDISLLTCYKILLTAINVGTALISYYGIKKLTGSAKIGICMSFLYTFSAYRLICIYVRAALGEFLAMTFLPLIALGVYEWLWGERKRWFILVIGMTGLLGAHVLSVEMCVLFIAFEFILWLFWGKKNQVGKRIWCGIKAVATTVLLNASLFVPFLYFYTQDLKCFRMSNAIANTGVYFSQMFSLFLSKDGSSLPRGTTMREMSLTVGAALLIGFLIFFLEEHYEKKQNHSILSGIGVHCASFAIISMLLASWLMPWGALVERISVVEKLTASLQFVWRFLGPMSFFMCICSSVGLARLSETKRELNWLLGIVVGLCLVTTWSLFDGLKDMTPYSNSMQLDAYVFEDDLYLYNDSSFMVYDREHAVPTMANDTEVVYSSYVKHGTHISMDVMPLAEKSDCMLLPLYYYPGYEIMINGKRSEALRVNTLLACEVPSTGGHIEVRYVGLPIFKAGDIISLCMVLGIICKFGYKVARRKRI